MVLQLCKPRSVKGYIYVKIENLLRKEIFNWNRVEQPKIAY